MVPVDLVKGVFITLPSAAANAVLADRLIKRILYVRRKVAPERIVA